jgi:hypothetical protein
MPVAEISIDDDGYMIVDLQVYPGSTLSDPMCKLSIDGKARVVPTGLKPTLPWGWRYERAFEAAILALLKKHDFILRLTGIYEQTRLGRIFP